MNWTLARAIRRATTSAALVVALIGPAAWAAVVGADTAPSRTGMPGVPAPLQDRDPGGMPTNPNDPRCAGAYRDLAQCQGGAYSMPTGPADPECLTQPLDPVCAGGPYAPPSPAPGAAPTGPADSACVSQPSNPICAGGPYAPPTPPPPPAAAPIAPPPMAPAMPTTPSIGGMGAGIGTPGNI
jgi:hypothetical protein